MLVHICCSVDSDYFLKRLCATQDKSKITAYFYDPNIHPYSEYLLRLNDVKRSCKKLGIALIAGEYDYESWLKGTKGLENEPERGSRCLKCFTLRLSETACYASLHGYSLFTTTLASSRWKSLDQINAAGRLAASLYPGVTFWEQNWRKGGLQERRNELLKTYDFYNQQYCGCEFSIRKE